MRNTQNYQEKRELEKAAMAATGLVSERYSDLASIEFQLTYYQRGLNRILMTRTLRFIPSNYAYFNVKCLHEGCVNGGYDLAPVVASMVKSRKKLCKGKLFCHGTNDSFGHASIGYEISVQYIRQVR